MATKYNHGPIGPWGSPLDFVTSKNDKLGIYVAETTQRFMLGAKVMTWDGRLFKYALAKGTLNADLLAKSYATQNLAFATVGAGDGRAAGDTDIKVPFGAADGYANSGLVVEDELAGGYVVIFSDTVVTMNRGIVGNTGIASAGDVVIYLDAPLNAAVAPATSFVEAMGSPYYDVRNDSDGSKTCVGLPVVEATTGQYCFLQTYGPTWVAPQSGVGATTLIRAVYARHDGSLDIRSGVGTNVTDQRVGYVLQNAQAGTQGAPFVQLQISI